MGNKKELTTINNQKVLYRVIYAIAEITNVLSFLYSYAFLLNSLCFLLYPIIWGNFPIKLKVQWGNFPIKVIVQ